VRSRVGDWEPCRRIVFGHRGIGVCHIVVSFKGGAPSFVRDVTIIPIPDRAALEAPPADAATDG
jgi:hypothetical protein